MTSKSYMIVDRQRLFEEAKGHKHRLDPMQEALTLSTYGKVLGAQSNMHALVDEDDKDGINAYTRAGFTVQTMNGNRATALIEFLTMMTLQLSHEPPSSLTVVSNDPAYHALLKSVGEKGQAQNVTKWTWDREAQTLWSPHYNTRPLEEILPGTKVPRIALLWDYENVHLGLMERGWNGSVKELMQAARDQLEAFGDLVSNHAYADFGLLNGTGKRDWQRELLEAGAETVYVVNERGKNTADLKIADAVRDLLEARNGDAVEVLAICTNDRDFKSVIETARQRGRQVKLLAIRGGLSRHLGNTVPERDIIYIDDFLTMRDKRQLDTPTATVSPSESYAPIVMRCAEWLSRQGERGWHFATTDQLLAALRPSPHDRAQIDKAVAAGVMRRGHRHGPDGPEETLGFNLKNPFAKTALHLVRWAPDLTNFCLNQRKMPYIDSNFLVSGMQRQKVLVELNAGQTRRDAEGWLRLLAEAGVLVPREQAHPSTTGKRITTWWLPQTEAPAVEAPAAMTATAAPPAAPEPPAPSGPAMPATPAVKPARPQDKPRWKPFGNNGTLVINRNRQTGSLAFAGSGAD